MKTTLTTTFALAVMVFAFNANPVMAGEDTFLCTNEETGEQYVCPIFSSVDELRDPEQAGNEKDVADSGNEGSTSAASASDQ